MEWPPSPATPHAVNWLLKALHPALNTSSNHLKNYRCATSWDDGRWINCPMG